MFLDLDFIFQHGLLKSDELMIVLSKLDIFLMEMWISHALRSSHPTFLYLHELKSKMASKLITKKFKQCFTDGPHQITLSFNTVERVVDLT